MRIELTVNNNPVDLRVSVLPTIFGESVVLRVLDRSNIQLSLDRIGLRADELDTLRDLIRKPNGIIVVTGPTGCGKTTTLYAALSELNEPTTKILTAEDPVEYDIDGLVQSQINTDQGLTFARLLRPFLRRKRLSTGGSRRPVWSHRTSTSIQRIFVATWRARALRGSSRAAPDGKFSVTSGMRGHGRA